jgi:hypothetical protein
MACTLEIQGLGSASSNQLLKRAQLSAQDRHCGDVVAAIEADSSPCNIHEIHEKVLERYPSNQFRDVIFLNEQARTYVFQLFDNILSWDSS